MKCGKGLCGDCVREVPGNEIACLSCVALQAASEIPPEKKSSFSGTSGRKRNIMIIEAVVVGICLLVVAFQMPAVIRAISEEPKPVRHGPYDTDRHTDQCLSNLWLFSRSIQNGDDLELDLRCPASGARYAISQSGDGAEVSCPNPGAHGLRKISASRKKPVPELVR